MKKNLNPLIASIAGISLISIMACSPSEAHANTEQTNMASQKTEEAPHNRPPPKAKPTLS